MVTRDQEGTESAANHAVPHEALGHSGQATFPTPCPATLSVAHSLVQPRARSAPQSHQALPHNAAGFQCAGAFTKARKQLQTGAAAEQMQAIDRQMQDLLERMRSHNQLIGTQHLAIEDAHRVQFFHKSTRAVDGTAAMQKSLEWPTKIDFSLFDKVAFPSGVVTSVGQSC